MKFKKCRMSGFVSSVDGSKERCYHCGQIVDVLLFKKHPEYSLVGKYKTHYMPA